MSALPSDRRKQLENVVQNAREIAETAARAALDRLAVAEARPWDHLSADQKVLRNRLRAHGRQLGDTLQANDRQDIGHLVTEVAYQQWHRMLFARFLAENQLLIHPEMGVAVTLEECQELAEEEGAEDGWALAGRFASRMLPQIFRPDEPALALSFAPEHQRSLEQLLEGLPAKTFTASDSLGWVYQFWQAKKKAEVNASGVKIGADELPAVTQLFTEPYMVQFLLHNTLGAWWVGRHPGEEPPIEMEYLRRLDDGSPAAGTFDGWPKTARELTVLDPCCGSGHFLVAAFSILVAFRMRGEGLSARQACDAVLRDNLFGLEIDERCTQIAAFALALAAWTYPGAGGYRPLPDVSIACSGLAVGAKREEWLALANGDERMRQGMGRLYDLFRDAPMLGSLIDPRRGSGDLFSAEFSELQPLLQRALEREKTEGDHTGTEIGIAAQGTARAAELLSRRYYVVTTNVPYLGRSSQAPILRDYIGRVHPAGRADLATAFFERISRLLDQGGVHALVTPHNWQFLARYRRLREAALREQTVLLSVRLGTGAFETIGGEVVNVVLTVIADREPTELHRIAIIDASPYPSASEKSSALRSSDVLAILQRQQRENPDARITYELVARVGTLLRGYAKAVQGLATHDDPQFARCFWELRALTEGWEYLCGTVESTVEFGGRTYVFPWNGGTGCYQNHAMRLKKVGRLGGWKSGRDAWGRWGISVSQMGSLPCTIYTGDFFDHSAAVIAPNDPSDLPAIWAYCSSSEFSTEVRKIDQALKVTNGSLVKVPFDVARWRRIADEQYPDGLPEPYSNDPTQWLFKGGVTDTAEPLQVAVARLLGYRWPDQEPNALDELADDDGIVCIPPVRGEPPAADRLRALLACAFGSDWSGAKEHALLEQVGAKSRTLEEWLRNEFFEQHFKLFHHRPFIWQIWDGARGGFSVLVNYHQLDRKRLELLTYTYLGDWIRRQEHAQRQGESGADERLVRARELQKKLELILAGEAPYDIFVRWKPLEEQPIGWEPDLNDGVRMNIRPFFEAGVLRKNPNIKWGKDRGRNPPDDPWGEERINDRHLTLAEKRAARAEAGAAVD